MMTTHQTLLFLTLILLLLNLSQSKPHCTPSSCGILPNISHPFRLKNDPKHCGDRRFELSCENNVSFVSLNSHKYYVKAIDYSNDGYEDTSTIRLVDASINNDDICSFPTISAYHYNFTYDNPHRYPYLTPQYSTYPYEDTPFPINFISCPNPLKNSSFFTDIVTHCAYSYSSQPNPTSRYAYIKVGHMEASDFPEMCELEVIVMTSLEFKDLKNVSLSEIHQSLLYGFEVATCIQCATPSTMLEKFGDLFSVLPLTPVIIVGLLCAVVCRPVSTIFGFAALSLLLFRVSLFPIAIIQPRSLITYDQVIGLIIYFIILAPKLIIFPFALWLLIYKFRRRHLSIYNRIESFLRRDNKLVPIRYSYSDIKKMTKGFQDKLGEGGYGSVYKGKLRSGHDVAVKLLGKSGANGQDFMNEIATIGRIHHVNVVKLVGYCAQGSKRALVFDFMPNGSLEKYIFNQEKMSSLDWNTKFDIAVGIARGIEYLHRGCDVQILHFDIKPHNILLDDKFTPKISDFGLAKSFSTEKNTVTITAARGTIGYVAPELINRSIGAISYKADVYSFGMLLMEMVGLNRNSRGNNAHSSQYFPYWIYDCFEQGKDIEIVEAGENNDSDNTRKLFHKMIIVALWCIQMSPQDRPSMNKVLEMFGADVERLRIPDYPSESTQNVDNVDQTKMTCSSDSVSLYDDASPSVEIIVQELQSLP